MGLRGNPWTLAVKLYPAPLEIETTPTTWSEEDRGGGHGIRIDGAH